MIDILMAVYNGEKYLTEQIESILSQTFYDWQLFICDDCSSDRSFQIAREYEKKYPEKIKAFRNDKPTGSAQANFMNMLPLAKAEYIMFSDQDDFWLPEKIQVTFNKMKEAENKHGNVPLLVHTELTVADESLGVLHERFTAFQGLDPQKKSLNSILAQNNVTGCTMMINRPLLEIAADADPDDMLMHDWWFALTAAAFGGIEFVPVPTVKYRQHGNNQLGAVNNRNLRSIMRIVSQRMKTKKRVSITYRQAECFYKRCSGVLPEQMKKTLRIYIDIPNHRKTKRMYLLARHGFLKQNFISAAGQLIFC